MMKSLVVLLSVVGYTLGIYNDQDRILLQDIKVLTLYSDRMTTGRRSSPVPQLKCVGGSAQNAYSPLTVQCYNRGFDGYDTQWECKTDMDNEFRFGKVEVTCEGYDYPNDPYILRGSCGLEYTLEYTKQGYQKQQGGYHGNQHHTNYKQKTHYSGDQQSSSGSLVMLGIVAVVIYVIYKTCLSGNDATQGGDAPPPYSEHDHHRQGPQAPPPPGFKPHFTSGAHTTGSEEYDDYGQAPPPPGFKPYFTPGTATAGSEGAFGASSHAAAGASTGGGFWTGAATGGLLGYLFGRNNSTGYGGRTHYNTPHTGGSWFSGNSGSGWGSAGGSWGSAGSSWGSGSSTSSGTRTASGFGGTKRR